jgi:hypothetical protein
VRAKAARRLDEAHKLFAGCQPSPFSVRNKS